jgi:hypothetical protein
VFWKERGRAVPIDGDILVLGKPHGGVDEGRKKARRGGGFIPHNHHMLI